MNPDILLTLFAIFGLLGVALFFTKSTRNMAYASLALAFLCMGLAALINNEPSALAAFLLALLAARRVKTKFDRR
jgi:dolichol kinase